MNAHDQMPINQTAPNRSASDRAVQRQDPDLHLRHPAGCARCSAVTESDWHTRQARQLLKILLTERPRPVSTDLLIEILWPHSTPNAAATTLRSAINALRNVLEPERPNRAPSKYIVTQAPGYAFHLTPDIWLDVEEFERRLNHRQHTAHDPVLRLHLLERAIDLYQDDYLISDPYADWLQAERERLRERFFNALAPVGRTLCRNGPLCRCHHHCRRMLARDEVRENAYQALMRYQAESGDSAGALLTYERCRAFLSDELGADPSPLTQSCTSASSTAKSSRGRSSPLRSITSRSLSIGDAHW